MIDRQTWDWFIAACIAKGWMVTAIRHPKSRAKHTKVKVE